MAPPTQRRQFRHKGIPFVITTSGQDSTLTVNQKSIEFLKTPGKRFRTVLLPHAEFADLESLARSVIENDPSLQ